MKKKEKQSLQAMSPEALTKDLRQVTDKLAATLLSRYTKQSKNIREVRTMRRKIAVIKTVLRQKELIKE